ncbi:MAG TPA: hypothetical protein VI685_21870 [Candidatus Angelobacter sp.]
MNANLKTYNLTTEVTRHGGQAEKNGAHGGAAKENQTPGNKNQNSVRLKSQKLLALKL